jgi:hypothetical protein
MLKTAAGTKVYVSSAPVTDETDTLAEFVALDWVEVGLVENLPEYGDEAAAVTFTSLGDGRVRKGKGARDAGSMTLTFGNDPEDEGQLAVVAAEGTNYAYGFRVVYPDRPVPAGSDTEEFFRGIVRSRRRGGGDVNAVLRRSAIVDIDSEVFEKPASRIATP